MDKAPDAFRTISEVADDLDVPQHVLRFWESRFSHIRPMKRAGGRRYYRADDVDLLRGIRHLLYGKGYTIRGVQRILKEQGVGFVQEAWRNTVAVPDAVDDFEDVTPLSAGDEPPPRGRGLRSLLRSGADMSERREPRLDHAETPHARAEPELEHASAQLDDDERRKLQAVLHELAECRRLLDMVLG